MSFKPRKKNLGEILVDSGVISREDFTRTLFEQMRGRKRLGEMLMEKGLCSEAEIEAALSSQSWLDTVDLKTVAIDPKALECISEEFARHHVLMPISLEGKELYVAMAGPLNKEVINDIEIPSGLRVKSVSANKSDINWAIDHYYHLNRALTSIIDDLCQPDSVEVVVQDQNIRVNTQESKKKSEATPVVRVVNFIISQAAEKGILHIHVEPKNESLLVRIAINGDLRTEMELPVEGRIHCGTPIRSLRGSSVG